MLDFLKQHFEETPNAFNGFSLEVSSCLSAQEKSHLSEH